MKTTIYAEGWFARGDEDLEVSKLLCSERLLPNPVCFHAQQAAEKYFKGFLAHHDRHIRKVHDLVQLLNV